MTTPPAMPLPDPVPRPLPRSITREPYETLTDCGCELDGPEDLGGHAEDCPAAPCVCPTAPGPGGDPVARHTAACLSRY